VRGVSGWGVRERASCPLGGRATVSRGYRVHRVYFQVLESCDTAGGVKRGQELWRN
jgi:hypothetical protein